MERIIEQMQIDLNRELERIDGLLDTLESARSEEIKSTAAKFIIEKILDDDNPITYQIAANYLAWVISNGIPRDITFQNCRCNVGWIEKVDGTVYPCEKCRPEQHESWWAETVDENWGPS